MKKRIIIIISIMLIGICIVSLYNTFAISSIVSSVDNTHDITLIGDSNSTVEVPAKSSKVVYYQICNTNKGKVQYGVGYVSDNIVVKVYHDTIDSDTGVIDYGENKFVKLKLINDSEEDDTVTLSTLLGYEHGGDLILSDNVKLVTETINEVNMLMNVDSEPSASTNFLTSDIARNEVATITFVDDNMVPEGLASFDVSKNQDNSIKLWYTKNTDDNTLYDIYIGSDNGTVSIGRGTFLFSNMSNLTEIHFSDNFDTSNATGMGSMFYNCKNLTNLDLSSFNTSKVTSFYSMFRGCSSLTTLNVSNFDTSNVSNMQAIFLNCSKLLKLDLSNFDTSNVVDMSYMFQACKNLIEINLSSFNTEKVKSMEYMFYRCESLTGLDLSGFKTQNVKNMSYMFDQCFNLSYLDLSNFDTSKVTNMVSMFGQCNKLSSLDVSKFNTSSVTTMNGMFSECNSLTSLDLSSFNTSNVTDMFAMFYNTTKLKSIDLRNADFTNVTNYSMMFDNTPTSCNIIVKDTIQQSWITSKFTKFTNVVVAS